MCSAKIGYANSLSVETSNCKKKERGHFEQRISSKKAVSLLKRLVRTTAGQFRYLLLNLVNLRDLFGVGKKLKETIFNNNNQINSTFTARTRVL